MILNDTQLFTLAQQGLIAPFHNDICRAPAGALQVSPSRQ